MKDKHDKVTAEFVSVETTVFATTSFIAYHKWPKAPEDVRFLRYLHRHVFHVRVDMAVLHTDRDIEFIQLRRELDAHCRAYYEERNLESMSCEMMARDIAHAMDKTYRGCVRSVEVSEDGENGATVRVRPL